MYVFCFDMVRERLFDSISLTASPRTLEAELRIIRAEEDGMLAGQRGSRIAKWIDSTAKHRKQGLASPEKLQTLWPWCCLVGQVYGIETY